MYHGDWSNGNMHGKGVSTCNDGNKYEGEYQNDNKHVQIFDFYLAKLQEFSYAYLIVMIRDQVFLLSLMADNMKVNGQTENNMEKESTLTWMEQLKQEYLKMENVPNGQKKEKVELEMEQLSDR